LLTAWKVFVHLPVAFLPFLARYAIFLISAGFNPMYREPRELALSCLKVASFLTFVTILPCLAEHVVAPKIQSFTAMKSKATRRSVIVIVIGSLCKTLLVIICLGCNLYLMYWYGTMRAFQPLNAQYSADIPEFCRKWTICELKAQVAVFLVPQFSLNSAFATISACSRCENV